MAKAVAAGKKETYLGWETQQRQVSKEAAAYDPYGAADGKGCASCQWRVHPDACVLVAGEIHDTGMSRFYTAPVETEYPPLRVTIVEAESPEETVTAEAREGRVGVGSVLTAIVSSLKGLVGKGEKEYKPFSLERREDGSLKFFVIYSNPFKDKHGSFLSEASHREYSEWIDTNSRAMPELHIWHCGPNSAIGKVEAVAYDKFAIAAGTIYAEREADALKLAELDLGVSHGFIGVRKDTNSDTYDAYRSFEISLLPRQKASNIWTDVELVTGVRELALTASKRDLFKNVLGWDDARLVEVEKGLDDQDAAIRALGVEFKEAPAVTPGEGDDKPVTVAQLREVVSGYIQTTAGVTGMAQTIAALRESNEKLTGEITTLKTIVEEVKKSDDEKVAAVYKGEIEKNPGGFVATQSATNLPSAEMVQAKREEANSGWLWERLDGVLQEATVK